MILLDTDVCIEILRGNQSVIEKRIQTDEQIAVSFMTVGELNYGAEKSRAPDKNRRLVVEFLLSVVVINSDNKIMQQFGRIKAGLAANRTPLADADVLVAATALTKCSKIVTGNLKHFSKIDGLLIENWIR